MTLPSVTVVAQRPVALGRAAAELLFSRIDGYDGPSRRVVVGTDFIDEGPLGWIFIVVGALAIVLALVMNNQRSRTHHTTEIDERRTTI